MVFEIEFKELKKSPPSPNFGERLGGVYRSGEVLDARPNATYTRFSFKSVNLFVRYSLTNFFAPTDT